MFIGRQLKSLSGWLRHGQITNASLYLVYALSHTLSVLLLYFYLRQTDRKREGGEREKLQFVVPLIYAFIASCMRPDRGSPTAWHIGTML